MRNFAFAFFIATLAIEDSLSKRENDSKNPREGATIIENKKERFSDPLWKHQWYLHDINDSKTKLTLNVLPCFDMNITGNGIRIAIVDDGVEWIHEDLRDNYDHEISYDFTKKDFDPMPEFTNETHGTECAGVIAMKPNNGICGVGVAYNAKIGGIKDIFGPNGDWGEAVALGYAYDKVDIYSNSWGPGDVNDTVGFGTLTKEAIERGIEKGRKGKGSIYVFAAGNGKDLDDDCNCDGCVNSIYTIAVAAASQKGKSPWYGESCSAILTTTLSSDIGTEGIVSTTVENKCTTSFGSTSAAAPLASGIIALALEANYNLTWRDVQHLIVWTSEHAPLKNSDNWTTNNAGLKISRHFGFGLMNAFAMVSAAKNWTNVPKMLNCTVDADEFHEVLEEGENEQIQLSINAYPCHEIKYLEHVELEINIDYPVRGALEVTLRSPLGTSAPLLKPRKHDCSNWGFQDWKLTSVFTWNENLQGNWTVLVRALKNYPNCTMNSQVPLGRTIGNFKLYLYGTLEKPAYLENGPRKYDGDDVYEVENGDEDEDQDEDQDDDQDEDEDEDEDDDRINTIDTEYYDN